jgi:hypothetical protein
MSRLDLTRTAAALAAFDTHGEILDGDAPLSWDDADMFAWEAKHERLGAAVAKAFADDTADLNARANALLMDPVLAGCRAGYLRRLIAMEVARDD